MTQQAKHTPGPWTADIGEQGANINVTNNYNHPLSFSFQWPYAPTNQDLAKEGQANARLIAAAPDLLEALQELSSLEVKGHALIDRLKFSEQGRTLSAKITAAITKAKGEAA